MDLCGLEEGYHEGLFVLRSMPSNQARQFGVDALSCRGSIGYTEVWGQGRAGGHNSIPTLQPIHVLAVHSSNKDRLGNSRSCFRSSLVCDDPCGVGVEADTITQW